MSLESSYDLNYYRSRRFANSIRLSFHPPHSCPLGTTASFILGSTSRLSTRTGRREDYCYGPIRHYIERNWSRIWQTFTKLGQAPETRTSFRFQRRVYSSQFRPKSTGCFFCVSSTSQTKQHIQRAIEADLQDHQRRAEAIITTNRTLVEEVATILIKAKTVNAETFAKDFEGRVLGQKNEPRSAI